MSTLKTKLAQKIAEHRPRTTRLLKEFGDVKVGEVTIEQAIGGVRDVKCLVTDISYLDPQEGIRFRGFTIPEVMAALPKPAGKDFPYVEGFWAFLLTGDIPTLEETMEIVEDFKSRSTVPSYVYDVLKALPKDSHPMVMFNTAILAMQKESKFAKFYEEGYNKMTAWESMYEDSTDMLARLPEIAAFIYRYKYKEGDIIVNPNEDIGTNFAKMMGIPAPYDDVARMYFILHSDHESGNASAHTTHLVASTLADAYYSVSAGMDALAGPLHGLANQEVLRWLQAVMDKLDGVEPTEEIMKQFVLDTLDSGQVIPGFGHAVLRKTDPRYQSQREFCEKHLPNDKMFKYVDMLYRVVPDILLAKGKAKNPWPNVDAQSGVIQWFYGITEYDFYTVMFGVGRSIGVLANITWDRALGYALERPKSLTTKMLEDIAAKAK
ncbi:MAG TPA: type I citrate synthase [Bacteroidales bacterium]|nr:type I citrate synthase [Bacteroidales bacterium]